MGKISDSFFDSAFYRRAVARWAVAAREAHAAPLQVLRRQSARAAELRKHLDWLIRVSDERLALPLVGSDSFPKSHNTDWAWRPEAWRGRMPERGRASVESRTKLGGEITLFHDCARSELTVRQIRNQRDSDTAPYGIRMDVFGFEGSFLSLVFDLPKAATIGLHKSHVLRVDRLLEVERPLEVFARLNIKHGPNTEQIVREFPKDRNEASVEFDLAYAQFNEKRVEKAWIDLIFENPAMNQITLRDLTFSRRPRAPL